MLIALIIPFIACESPNRWQELACSTIKELKDPATT